MHIHLRLHEGGLYYALKYFTCTNMHKYLHLPRR